MENHVYYRLITLWICCEAMLGSIIHFFKLPASGLIVGSCAVICICLIAHYAPVKGSILKAALIVAIFKMMLSPQVRPTAYIAVFFQALMGEALFWNKKMYRLSCLLLGMIALLESGLQRVIVLTIVYGNDLWNAINIFINGLTGKTTNYSYFIIIGYALLHVAVGMLVGLWAGVLPEKIRSWIALHKEYLITSDLEESEIVASVKKKKKLKKGVIAIWLVLFLLYVQSVFNIGPSLLPPLMSITIIIRSLLILMTFYFLVGPALSWLLNRWLQRRKAKESVAIQKVLYLLPATKQLVIKSWQLSAIKTGRKRILLCCKIILLNGCYSPDT